MLLLTVLAFAVDQRVWLAGPPLLVAAARTAWLAYVRRRASRSYVRRLLTERHEVRFDAWRRLERSRRSTAWVSFTIAGMFAFTCLTDVSAHTAPGSPASPPVTEILTREIRAIDKVKPAKLPGPLGLLT